MERYSASTFGIRDLSKVRHWSTNIDDFRIKTVTYVCLGGNGCLTQQLANGQAARNERLLGLKPKDADQYCTYNNIDVIAFCYGRDKKEDITGNITISESEKFINQLFMPLFINEETGKRFDHTTCCSNFSQLIFSTHCYGAECVNNFLYDLKIKLLKNNFSSQEIDEIFSYSFHLSYSPLYREDSFLPFMQINSLKDSFSETYNLSERFLKKYGHFLDGVEIFYDKKPFYSYLMDCATLPIHKEINVYSSQLLNSQTLSNFIDEHTSIFIDLDENYNCSRNAYNSKNSECCSRIASIALAMAGARALNIKNKKIPLKPFDLLEVYNASQDVLLGFNQEDLMEK